MAGNFLEQLAAEWYEYQGYFVRRNVLVGKRTRGGYECELDVVAFHPERKHLVHIEPSLDASSWEKRELRYQKKFDAGRRHIPSLFRGLDVPPTIDQLALLMFASTRNIQTLGGGRIVLVGEFLLDIFTDLRSKHPAKHAVPENLPILRAFQLVAAFRDVVREVLDGEQ
jgi:hypothetical protein